MAKVNVGVTEFMVMNVYQSVQRTLGQSPHGLWIEPVPELGGADALDAPDGRSTNRFYTQILILSSSDVMSVSLSLCSPRCPMTLRFSFKTRWNLYQLFTVLPHLQGFCIYTRPKRSV